MAIKTYIDGAEGTTGLQLKQRLLSHPEIQIISVDVNKRKDLSYKLDQFSNSDLIFLCLPDNEASLITDKINENFGSHIVATYETIEECNAVAEQMRVAYKNTKKKDEFSYLLSNQPLYRCAPVPNN